MKNKLIISHVADIDGLGAVILAKLVYNIDYILIEPHELERTIKNDYSLLNKYDVVYIVDLPLKNDICKFIDANDLKKKIRHFDHHIEKIDKKYKFYNVVTLLNGKKTCGTELFYKYLLEEMPVSSILRSTYIIDFVEAIRSFDNWEWKGKNILGKQLTNILSVMKPDTFIKRYTKLLKNYNNKKLILNELDLSISKAVDIKIESYIDECDENSFNIIYERYKIRVVIAEDYRSFVGDALANKYKKTTDFILIVNFLRKSISLRTANNINMGKVAKALSPNGGGHLQAAGLPFDKYSKTLIVNIIKEYLKINNA